LFGVLFLLFFVIADKGYLKKLETDPDAVINLGDSAYNRSNIKNNLGLGVPRPLPKDGVQQKVLFFSFFSCLTLSATSRGKMSLQVTKCSRKEPL
jgi:hypothetical protein